MIHEKFLQIGNDYRSKVFLINIAKQLRSGVLPHKIWTEKLLPRIEKSRSPKNIVQAISGQRPPWEGHTDSLTDLYFSSSFNSSCTNDTILVRVGSFYEISRSVHFPDLDSAIEPSTARANTRGVITQILRKMERRNPGSAEVSKLSKQISLIMSRFDASETMRQEYQISREIDLPNVVRAQINFKTFGLKAIGDLEAVAPKDPKFVSFAETQNKTNDCILQSIARSESSADESRDQLGLDHLGSVYKGTRVALGFLVFPYGSLLAKRSSRPTPLDNAINFRFKGVHGTEAGVTTRFGRAVNLTEIDADSRNIDGLRELVVGDARIDKASLPAFVGYLGLPEIPRKDERRGISSMSPWDDCFLDKLLDCLTFHQMLDELADLTHVDTFIFKSGTITIDAEKTR